MVAELAVSLGARSYPIYIGQELLADRELIRGLVGQHPVVIVSNEVVAPLYLKKLQDTLGVESRAVIILPDGEQHKTLDTLESIFDQIIQAECDRSSVLLALGGGVVGDVAGFAAACYQRGIPFIQIPTTLLAQVDSSVGGKTAVNHPAGKNMIGAFYQPQAVIIDVDTLGSLGEREYRAGLAEVIKYGLIRDAEFFEWLEQHIDDLVNKDASALVHAIEQSCRNKAEVVAADEREQGQRALLNLGHTFGHAIETATGYGVWLHGEAVAIGMVLAMRFSVQAGFLTEEDSQRGKALLEQAGLPVDPPGEMTPENFVQHMRHDKKVLDGIIRLVLMRAIGNAFVCVDYDADSLFEALQVLLD